MWLGILREWIASGFAEHVVFLDRAGTGPRLIGLHSHPMIRHDYSQTGPDSLYLQRLCDKFDADLFISTHYTTPTTTPSIFLCCDMTSEALGLNMEECQRREKHRAIGHASTHLAISENCANHLEHLALGVKRGATIVARLDLDPIYSPAEPEVLDEFRRRFRLDKPWVYLPGERVGTGGHKNGELVFRAMAAMADKSRYILLCSGGAREIEPHLLAMAEGVHIRHENFSDAEMVCAYSGAHACVYPSRYENFGMSMIEAMACGCPVISCRSPGLEEAASDAAIFISDHCVHDLGTKLVDLESPEVRDASIRKGLSHAVNYRHGQMAGMLAGAIEHTVTEIAQGRRQGASGLGWEELRKNNA